MIFRFDDFELDEDLFELRRGGQAVAVQRKVLETLFYLVRHRDRLVRRDELWAGPWAGSVVGDGAIAQAIRHARRALGDKGDGQRMIRTVRGKGLRFVRQVSEQPGGATRVSGFWPVQAAGPSARVFVGRGPELARLHQALESAHAGAGKVILVGGDAGIGKTSLIERLASDARSRQVSVLWGRGWEVGDTPAFWPWLELLRGIVEIGTFTELGRPPEGTTRWLDLVPEARARVPHSVVGDDSRADAGHARVRLFDSVARFLIWVSDTMDVLVLLENVHVADGDSMALLRYVAPRIHASRLLIIGTFRPDALRTRNYFARELPDAEAMFLDGLAATDVEELLRATAPASCDPQSIAEIHRVADGNPLMVTELSAVLLANPRATFGSAEVSQSQAARWCLDRRIASLPESTAKLLEIGAVAGTNFELPLVASVSGIDGRDALARLRPAVERGVLRADSRRPDTYEFAHALFADAANRRLTPEQRCDLHARCASVLERDEPLEDNRVYRVAHHYWMSSPIQRKDRARKWALEAARRARWTHAHEAECEQLARAIKLGEGLVLDSTDEIDLMLELGEAERLTGKRTDAIATFEKAASLSRAIGDARRFADAAIARFDVVGDAAPVDTGLQQQVTEALELLCDETPQRATLLAVKAFSQLFFRLSDEGRELSNRALRMSRDCGSPAVVAKVVTVALRFCEDGRQLLPLANELVTAAEQAKQSEPLLFGHFCRCWGLLEIGRLHEWHAAAAEHGRLSVRLRHPTHTYWSTIMSAVPMVLGADLDSAYERARSGYQLGEEVGDPLATPLFGCALLSIYRSEDGRAEALRWLPDLRAIAVKTLELAPAYVPWRVIMMNIDHALGRVDIATREFRRFVEPGYEAINRDRNYFAVLSELGRMAALLGDREHIEKLYALLLPYAGMHLVPMCGYLGPVHYSLALLRRALADSEGASDHFGLALADAESVEARSWIEKIRLEMSGEDARGSR